MAENVAKKEQVNREFNPGDLAVYPAHGVGRIEAVEVKEIGGNKQEFYIMKILENSMVIMIPVTNVNSVGLRSVIGRSEIKKVYKVMKSKKESSIDNQTWNRRYREYMDR